MARKAEAMSRRWPESEIDTLTSMDKVEAAMTPPAPVKRKIMEQEPEVKRPPTREEVERIEDQILRLAFGRAVKSIRIRTLALVFMCGMAVGFVGLGVALVVLLDKAGAP